MAIVCCGYPEIQVSKENFVSSERFVGLWMNSLKRGSPPKFTDFYWTKGADIMICQDAETRDWLARKVPTLTAWEGSTSRWWAWMLSLPTK
jgi:hypothetical protein